MNHRSSLSVLTLFLVCLIMLTSGCSETTKQAPSPDKLVFPVYFPLIENANLYSLENSIEYGVAAKENQENILEQKLLLTSPTGLILALDTDQSAKDTEGSIETFIHTPLPEYIAYAKKHTLHIYDLNTRFDHQVYSFETDEFFEAQQQSDKSPTWFICDIQKVITWDEESRLSKKVLFKDELAVYVKTSSQEDCSAPVEGFKFWQINIETSTNDDETFTIRRRILKEHSHNHKHFHDHDNENDELFAEHDHQHTLEEGELDEDGLPFVSNNHKHKHTHSHDFVYGPEHAHELLTQEEKDEEHNDPRNHEIEFETHPKLIGKRTTITSIDEALMYSGTPVIDIAARNFGYLGLNSTDEAFKFYSVNFDTLEKKLLWSQHDENLAGLTNHPMKQADWKTLVPAYNRPLNFLNVNNGIAIFANALLFNFSLESIFDDDATETIAQSLSNPLFSSNVISYPISQRSQYNPVEHKMVIVEDKQLWLIDFNTTPPIPTLIKTYNEPNLYSLFAQPMGGNIMVTKDFSENELITSSITTIQENGLEINTLLAKTPDTLRVIPQRDESLVTIIDSDNGSISAKYFLNNFGSPIPVLLETMWVNRSFDYRDNVETQIIAQLSSNNLPIIPGTIEQPSVYILDNEDSAGRGEKITEIPDAAQSASGLVIFNEFYSIVEYTNSENILTTQSTITNY